MTTTIDAIYEGGVFRPTREVVMKDGTHVEVIVPQSAALPDPGTAARLLSAIAAKAAPAEKPDTSSIDHDRILYGARDKA